MKAILKRNYFEKQTEGLFEISINGEIIFNCRMLELPWIDNKRSISCIPEGKYKITKEIQKKRWKVLRLHNVENRSGILMHFGNYAGSKNPKTKIPDTKGCLLPGKYFADIDNDGLKDVTHSKSTMNYIYNVIENETILTIKS